MARQGYYTNPAEKKLEIYRNFSKGMNSAAPVDNLRDDEVADLKNIELGVRGSLSRRTGFVRHISVPVAGKAQGFFRYYKADGTHEDIVAVNGSLYKNGVSIYSGFQTVKPIEAVQYQGKLYIASGSGLLEYNGVNVTAVVPYKPKPLEALYVGTNGLADNPDDYMSDQEGITTRIDGVTFDKRYGVTNEFITITAYVTKPATTNLEYKFERRLTTDKAGYWFTSRDWATDKAHTFSTDWVGDMQVKVSARVVGQSVEAAHYIVPKYKIKPAQDPNDVEYDTSSIDSCNRILLHWDRLVLYGDDVNKSLIFVSHLKNPAYIPIPNTLEFETPSHNEDDLVKIVKYRDNLVAFTDTSIQALYGKSPADFRRVVLNTDIGCIAPESVSVVGNHVAFLSSEGIHVLKSLGYSEDKANVERIDLNVANHVNKSALASAVFFDGQYRVHFPEFNKNLRCYTELGYVWSKDESSQQYFERFNVIDNRLYAQYKDTGHVVVFDETVYTDDGFVYEDRIETKGYDFGQPHHLKKLKELQLLMKHHTETVSNKVYVYADGGLVLNPDSESYASVDANGYVVWNTVSDPNLVLYPGTTFGTWSIGNSALGEVLSTVQSLRVSGKCRKTRIVLSHEEAKPNAMLGIGFIFKMKKP